MHSYIVNMRNSFSEVDTGIAIVLRCKKILFMVTAAAKLLWLNVTKQNFSFDLAHRKRCVVVYTS